MDLSAKRAWIGKDGKEVRLEGDVRLVRAGSADIPETVITSREMYIYPDEEIARSDAPITIARGRSVLSGGAFDADGRRDTLLIKGPVRGTIVPRDKSASR
jgi:lipopolysaccharide export system protein LptC